MSAFARAADGGLGLVAHKIFDADFTPMLSPALAVSIGGVKEPLKTCSSCRSSIRAIPGGSCGSVPRVSLSPICAAIRAAVLATSIWRGRLSLPGRASGILTPAFYETELAQGQLIQPFEYCRHRRPFLLARVPGGAAQRAEDPRLPRLAAGSTGKSVERSGSRRAPPALRLRRRRGTAAAR